MILSLLVQKINHRSTSNQFAWLKQPTPEHTVFFYDFESKLLTSLFEYIGTGLKNSDTCIVIATDNHTKLLKDRLHHAYPQNKCLFLDAQHTLNMFTTDGQIDRAKFFKVIGGLMEEAAAAGRPIRAFGEMVALLWKRFNYAGVVELEELWNDLSKKYQFSLYCAYPIIHFDRVAHATELEKIHQLHNPHRADL